MAMGSCPSRSRMCSFLQAAAVLRAVTSRTISKTSASRLRTISKTSASRLTTPISATSAGVMVR